MRRQITQADLDYIRANYLRETDAQMAKARGLSKSPVCRARVQLGLRIPNELKIQRRVASITGRTKCTPEDDQILLDHYLTMPKSKLALMIGRSETCVVCRLRQLGLVIPREIIEQRKADSRIKKGAVPPNKGLKLADYLSEEVRAKIAQTTFKKGSIPPNRRPVGYERITVDGYVEVKTGEGPRQFRLKHRIVWEEHNGPIPKGTNIQFEDGNTQNCDIGNLYAIDRAGNMLQNTYHNWPKELALSVQLRGALNRKINNKLKSISDEK